MSTTNTGKTLSSLGDLTRLLPTGTVFVFQFVNPVLINNGQCSTTNKYLSSILIVLCGLSCFLSSFTDSYTDENGNTLYGIVTIKGLWTWSSTAPGVDLSRYKLSIGDFAHAFLAVIVFAMVVLLDGNTVQCLYRPWEKNEKVILMVLPPVIGTVSSSVFMMFPNNRHGIGYRRSYNTS